MRLILKILIVFLFFHSHVFGQIIPLAYDTLSLENEMFIETGIDFASTAIQRDLSSKFFYGGGYIDNQTIDNSYNRHVDINTSGAYGGFNLEYRNYKKKLLKNKDWGYLIRVGTDFFGGATYSKDFFGLMFYGNDKYKGETIDFSGFNCNFMSYQKLGFGMVDVKSKSSVSINLYNINNRFNANFRTGQITQDINGDLIEFVLDGDIELRDSEQFNQGIGLGFDFDFKLPISLFNKEISYIQFQARNVGFGYMYQKQKIFSVDTTISFDGFEFDQLLGDNSIFSDSLIVLDSIGISSKEKNRAILLPGYLQISKIVNNNTKKKLQSFFGIRFYPSLIFNPYLFCGLHYTPSKFIGFGLNVGYGGFAKFRSGIYTNINLGNYSLGLASENILGFFTRRSSGQSLFIRLRCVI